MGAVAKLPLILCGHCWACMSDPHSGTNTELINDFLKTDLLFGPENTERCLLAAPSVHAQIAGYVNQPMVDVSILQRSLAILESMVLNSHSLYHRVAQEITVGQLIGHLQV